jgi:enoyl-CoA hydratase/carnithine racemase
MKNGVDAFESDSVAIIRFDRSDVLSPVDLEAAKALRSAVSAAERSRTARWVVPTAAGRQFSDGRDTRFFHGTACELMLAADVVVAASNCRFAQVEVKRGVMANHGATLRMVERAG